LKKVSNSLHKTFHVPEASSLLIWKGGPLKQKTSFYRNLQEEKNMPKHATLNFYSKIWG